MLQQMIFPRIEETRAAVESVSVSNRDVATQCFLDLLAWFRIVILQDAVFLRKQFPFLNLWKHALFNHSDFEEYANNLLHEANFGEDPQYVQIAKIMPKLAQLMQDHQQNIMTTLATHHRASEQHKNQIQAQLDDHANMLKLLSQLMQCLGENDVELRTRLTLNNENISLAVSSVSSNSSLNSARRPEAAASAHISESSIVQYQLNASVVTITALWEEYDRGIVSPLNNTRGSSIRELDAQYDNK